MRESETGTVSDRQTARDTVRGQEIEGNRHRETMKGVGTVIAYGRGSERGGRVAG